MADNTVLISLQQLKPIKIRKWKVSAGCTVSIGRVILLYDFDGVQASEQRKLKSSQAGTVVELLAPEGAIVCAGGPLLRLKACIHPTVMKDMCAECGADLRKEETSTTASVPMVHSIPELKVSEEVAQKLGKADGERLIRDRKLVLLVDLDQTLIHTTNDNIPPNIKDVYHFQLYGPNSPWYHTRLRPGTHTFLSNISQLFELHICTFGARNYAHMIAMFLDGDQTYFSNRILSRDECFDPTSKKANLRALFPCGDNMVCIIDDREDVWNHASNLIHVKPYHFFKHTGDINAPPGLDKQEADNKEGVDLSNIKKTKLNGRSDQLKEANSTENGIIQMEENKIQEVLKNGSEESNVNDQDITMETEESRKSITTQDEDVRPSINMDEEEGEIKEDTCKTDETTGNPAKDETNEDSKDDSCKETKETSCKIEDLQEESYVGTKTDENSCGDDKYEEKEQKAEEHIKTKHNTSLKANNAWEISSKETDKEESPEQKVQKECETKAKDGEPVPTKEEKAEKDEELIEIEDADDYLLYLEDILKLVHKRFYEEYDKLEAGTVPDLKVVIPSVRGEILKGTRLVFSGLVPTHIKLEQSKAYQVARSLGATVTQDIDDATTHLVAVRPGTAKVNAGRRRKHLKIVTPDWLWACAERWEHIEEGMYPLNSKGSKNRHPPPHCSSPEHVANYPTHEQPAVIRKRTPSGRFMDTINPLMSFSSDDIADMDKEVEDILDDESDSDGEAKPSVEKRPDVQRPPVDNDNSSSSEESLTGEFPRGFKRMREDTTGEKTDKDGEGDSTLDEFPSAKFRRGEELGSDLDFGQDSNSEGSVEPQDEVDDGEWNMMGAALEREFLSNN